MTRQPADVPRTSRRRAIGTVAAGLLVVGAPLGALWAWLAPAVHGVVVLTHQGDRVHDYLGPESDHFFVAAALMLGLVNVVAVVAAVLVWQWRAHRGPGMVAGLCTGVLGTAAAAAGVGALLVHWHYGGVDVANAPVTHEHPVLYFTQAPPVFFGHTAMQVACTLLLPVATTALVYAVLVAATARDDLGAYPGIEAAPPPAVVVTADGGAPSVR
jgi:hypothetical protein